MKTFKKNLFLFLYLFAATSMFIGCDEDSVTPEEQDTTVTAPTPSDAFGHLIAVKTFSKVEVAGISTDVEFGTAVGVFIDGSNFLPAGTVTANSEELTRVDNNSYTYMPDFGSPSAATGITFGNSAIWNVTGEGSVPAVSKTYDGFPSKPVITSTGSVTISSGHTMTWNAIGSADSIIVSIFGSNDAAMKTVAGNATQVTFSSDDLSGIGTTDFGTIQVAAYRQMSDMFSGNKVYFTNQSASTATGVAIQ